ncbi:hypothetical protein MLD38_040680 [Melastoma candidum]|nr:hypothetical protein MLD38_040680 [Melastoma candidum]
MTPRRCSSSTFSPKVSRKPRTPKEEDDYDEEATSGVVVRGVEEGLQPRPAEKERSFRGVRKRPWGRGFRRPQLPGERVRESLQEMRYRCEEGCSPVVALKRRHCMRRKSKGRRKARKGGDKGCGSDEGGLSNSGGRSGGEDEMMVLEDLGPEYLEELLIFPTEHYYY